MEKFNSFVNEYLEWTTTNKYVSPMLLLIFAVYVAQARPKLPKTLRKLFKNSLVRLIIFTYLLYKVNLDLQVSIMIAIGFLLITHIINRNDVEDFAADKSCKKDDEGSGPDTPPPVHTCPIEDD
jgi:hypothetical protein